MGLNERKRQILRAVVNAYIETGEPVGSKLIAGKNVVELSSATIRNEMAELEEMGYLEQPHTSAGRIPTNSGYREYVDNLMQQYRLTAEEIRTINEKLRLSLTKLDSIIEQSGRVMSQLTDLTAVGMLPGTSHTLISRFEILPIDAYSFLMVAVMQGSIIKTRHIRINFELEDELTRGLSALLNEKLAGRRVESLSLSEIMEMEHRMGKYSSLVSPILKTIYQAINDDDRTQLFVDGMNNLLRYPEYQDVSRAREIIQIFERRQPILKLLDTAQDDGVSIFIGDEHAISSHDDISLVFRKFASGGQVMGGIGIIGPKRMDYSKVIARLDYCSQIMSELLMGEGGDDDITI